MLGDTVGYAQIKNDANVKNCMGDANKNWLGKIVRCLELNNSTKSALVIDASATQMGMFDFDDLELKFECSVHGGVILPPNIGTQFSPEVFIEANKRLNRKGGYSEIIKNMVIVSSLQCGEFNDNFLFQKQ